MARNLLSSGDKQLILRLLSENFKKHALWYGLSIIAMLVVAGSTSLSAWIMRDIVNSVFLKARLEVVLSIAASVAAIFMVKGVATFVQSYYLSKAGNSIVAEQQRRVYDRLLQQGVSFFQNMPSSEVLVRVTYNAQAARSVIDTIVTSFIRDLFTLLGLVAVMLFQNFLLTSIALIMGPLAIFGVRLLLKRVRSVMEAELASVAQIVQVVQETSIGVRVIKAFALEGIMRHRMNNAVMDVEKRANGIALLESATSPIMETLSGLAIAAIIALSGYNVVEHGGTPGDLMAFITALLLAYEPAKRLARMRVNIQSGLIGVRMMFEVIDTPLTLEEAKDAIDLPRGRGEIIFKNVCFSYAGGHQVLPDLDLIFPANKMTALVGPSGSGKSTIVNLIMRLYDPQAGSVMIDGIDLRQVSFASLRENMSYVGQDTFLFAGTIRHNIGLGRPGVAQEEIVNAAKSANAHNFIMQMEHGYDTVLDDNGSNLSGGQRQRIAIARAMLRDAQILILDEATSALDSESEAAVRDALHRLTEGRTTIVIAHRLSTIATADKIIVLEDGRIVEQGNQSELLQHDGLFKRLYSYQFTPHVEANMEVYEADPIPSPDEDRTLPQTHHAQSRHADAGISTT